MVYIKLILFFILFVIGIIFSTYNLDKVSIKFLYISTPQIPLYLVIFSSVFLGILVGMLANISGILKLRAKVKKQEKRIKELQDEIGAKKSLSEGGKETEIEKEGS